MEYEEGLIKHLLKIGLTESEVSKFNDSSANKDKQIEILKKGRYRILNNVHEQEKAIQQLDYLIYEIKKS